MFPGSHEHCCGGTTPLTSRMFKEVNPAEVVGSGLLMPGWPWPTEPWAVPACFETSMSFATRGS